MHLLNLSKGNKLTILLSVLLAVSVYEAWQSHQSVLNEKKQLAEAYATFQYTIKSQNVKSIRLYNNMERKLRDIYANDSIYMPVIEQIARYSDKLEIVLDGQIDPKLYNPEKLRKSIEQFCDNILLLVNEEEKIASFKQTQFNSILEPDDPIVKQTIILESKIALNSLKYYLLSTQEDRIIASVPEYQTIWSGY